ncbi:MAG: tetratricopeptide repeat protein [Methanobrevibacter sp.]
MSNLDNILNKASSKKSKKEDTQLTFDTNLDVDSPVGGVDSGFGEGVDSQNDTSNYNGSINSDSNNFINENHVFDFNLKDIKLKNKIDNIFSELNNEFYDNFELNIEKAKVLADIEEYGEAIKFLDLALDIKEDTKVLYIKAKYLHELNDDKESLLIIDKILELDDNCFDTLKLKVILLCNLKEYDLADSTFNKAISVNPNDYEIWQQYADIFDSLDNQEKALKINALALKRFPNELDLLYDRRYYLINGGYNESIIDNLNDTINNLESTAEDPNYSSGVVNIEEAELELEPENNIGSKGYEDNDSEVSDDNDIYDLDSENKHYDDEENIVDLDYDKDFESIEDTEENEFKKKSNKTKELTLDSFF